MSKPSLFITFEGVEGSGKTTHSKLLCSFLRRKGFKILYTREPGGTLIGERIRDLLLDTANKDMDVFCEMLLYMAARAEIVQKKILPALKKEKIVVCDRFMDATLSYQGYAGGIGLKLIKDIGRIAARDIQPDITFLLDIDAKKGLLRSGSNKDRMERKSLLYHKRVRDGYLAIARKEKERVKIVSAEGDIDRIQDKVRKVVLEKL